MTEDEVRFIVAEIICGLEAVHARQIVHRDLTLRHIILDKMGHAHITAFENCKFLKSLIRGRLRVRANRADAEKKGSDQAPEVLTGLEYGFSPDFWSLGMIMFQLLHWDLGPAASQPFESPRKLVQLYQHHQKRSELEANKNHYLYGKGMDWENHIGREAAGSTAGHAYYRYLQSVMKPALSKEAKDLLQRLLCLNRLDRLGCNGFDQIKNHHFFASIDFDMIKSKKYVSPFKFSEEKIPSLTKRNGRKLKPIARHPGSYIASRLSNSEQNEFNRWEFSILSHLITRNCISDQLVENMMMPRDIVMIIIDFILLPKW